ncbi:hypothetical protein OG21DRAFT_1600676 [Imleria badia]|nr:hypothetical protein OG21DRAFT_1600676 [Imleria badia]
MSEQSIKRSKKHRKSEREEKGSKVKKSRKSGTVENPSHDPCGEGLQCSTPPTTKLESTRDPTLTREVGDQLSSTPPGDTPSKVKGSRKRKRADRDVTLDESVSFEPDSSELEPPKKCDQYREVDRAHCLPYSNPAIDETLSEPSRRALSYAYERCLGSKVWKFNKARQNWLLRNVWSEQAIPESYIPLMIGYLDGLRGGAREKLIEECISKTSTSERAPIQGVQPSNDGNEVGVAINQEVDTSRALSILHALRNS